MFQSIGNYTIKKPNRLSAIFVAFSVFVLLASSSVAQEQTNELTDNDILEAVEMEFRTDDGLSPDMIGVQVNDGIVNLDGEVLTLLSRRQAVRSVGSLKGVKAIVDNLRVSSSPRSGDEILADVQTTLQNDPVTNHKTTSVSVDEEGKVTLDGKAGSYMGRILAESVVAGVSGVTDIDNRLAVEVTDSRPASEIQSAILRRFELSPYLAEGLIDVELDGKTVVLSGSVGSVNERELARVFAWVSGVEEVFVADLKIDSSQVEERRRDKFTIVRNDIEIQEAVTESLLYDPRVRSAKINVVARFGAISLHGKVASLTAKQSAERDAWNTVGVRRVANYLRVTSDRWPGDLELTEQANAVIFRDTLLTDSVLTASSHFGKMYIRGEANTNFAKNRVGSLLANIPGVREIVNRVKVDSGENEKRDEDIFEDCVRRLRWSPLLDANSISVSVVDGIVTLDGETDTWQERRAAERHALQSGAHRVKNKLKVRSAGDATLG